MSLKVVIDVGEYLITDASLRLYYVRRVSAKCTVSEKEIVGFSRREAQEWTHGRFVKDSFDQSCGQSDDDDDDDALCIALSAENMSQVTRLKKQ